MKICLSRTPCGFTLIELLLVVVLLVVVTTLAVPNFSRTYQRMVVRQSADELALLMRYAQSRAISKGVVHRLHLDFNEGSYWLAYAGSPASGSGEGAKENIPERWAFVRRIPSGLKLASLADSTMSGGVGAKDVSAEPDAFAGLSMSPAQAGTDKGQAVDFLPDGKMTKAVISVCQESDCLLVSTKEQMGYVEVLDATK